MSQPVEQLSAAGRGTQWAPMRYLAQLTKVVLLLAAVWHLEWVVGCLLVIPGHWDPRIGGSIPGGAKVYYQFRHFGRESEEVLIVIATTGNLSMFDIAEYRAGHSFVAVRCDEAGERVWIVSEGAVVASLDLTTGEFFDAYRTQPEWATPAGGLAVGSGRTYDLLQLLTPW